MRILRLVLLICAVGILNGCFFDHKQDAIDYVNEVKRNSAGKVDPLPPSKEYRSEEYTAQNLRSPFNRVSSRNVVSAASTNTEVDTGEVTQQQPRPDAERKREFLEKFPLNTLVMVGTMSKENNVWGLLQDNTGIVYPVKVGDYVGENSGHITKITADEIDLIETVPDGKGGWKQTNVAIRLKTQ